MGRRGRYRQNNRTTVLAVTGLIGRKYLLGGNGAVLGEPFDCFGMLVEYCRLKFKVDILLRYAEMAYPFDVYAPLFEASSSAMKYQFKEFLDTCFLKVTASYRLPGDMLWCSSKENGGRDTFLGIFIGAQRVVVTSEHTGCIVMDTKYYDINGAYRCPLRSP